MFPKLLESGYNPHTTLPVYFVVGISKLMLIDMHSRAMVSSGMNHESQVVLVLDLPTS